MAAHPTDEGVPTQPGTLASSGGCTSGGPLNFGVATYDWDDAMCVTPEGELDLATVDQLEDALRRLHDAGTRSLVLDLRKLTFMASTGLRLMLRWHEFARRDGFEFRIVDGPPIVRRVFDITGLRSVLPVIAMDPQPSRTVALGDRSDPDEARDSTARNDITSHSGEQQHDDRMGFSPEQHRTG